jgi:serine/threonine protein kinase
MMMTTNIFGCSIVRLLQSDNIFMTLNERKDIHHLAIADFDTAQKVSAAGGVTACIGTPAWMAPEVMNARPDTEYSFPVDGMYQSQYQLLLE